jgi:hypothetical protein
MILFRKPDSGSVSFDTDLHPKLKNHDGIWRFQKAEREPKLKLKPRNVWFRTKVKHKAFKEQLRL